MPAQSRRKRRSAKQTQRQAQAGQTQPTYQPQQPQAITNGTVIRMANPSSQRGQHKPNPAVMIVQEINPVGGFIGFLREHAVVGLAIGFIIGTQAQGLVKLLVSSFIDPAFQLLFGKALSQQSFTLSWHSRDIVFHWGDFAYGLLNFLFVLIAIYAIVKILNLDKLDKPADSDEEEDEDEEDKK